MGSRITAAKMEGTGPRPPAFAPALCLLLGLSGFAPCLAQVIPPVSGDSALAVPPAVAVPPTVAAPETVTGGGADTGLRAEGDSGIFLGGRWVSKQGEMKKPIPSSNGKRAARQALSAVAYVSAFGILAGGAGLVFVDGCTAAEARESPWECSQKARRYRANWLTLLTYCASGLAASAFGLFLTAD